MHEVYDSGHGGSRTGLLTSSCAAATAKLDAGAMWPTSFALTKLTPADEKKIKALVKKAVG